MNDGHTNDKHNLAWERLPNESDTHFWWYQAYRDYGLSRSYGTFIKYINDNKQLYKGKTITAGQLSKLNREYNWKERILAYDRFIESNSRELALNRVKMQDEKLSQLEDLIMEKIESRLKENLSDQESLSSLARAYGEMLKGLRLRRGDSTDNVNLMPDKIRLVPIVVGNDDDLE